MTEYELDQICEMNPECGGRCMSCELFAEYIDSQDRDPLTEEEEE